MKNTTVSATINQVDVIYKKGGFHSFMSRNPFVFPLDDEVEKMLEDLPEGLYKPIWKLINHHRTERPKCPFPN